MEAVGANGNTPFIAVNQIPADRFQAVWEEKVFAFLLKAERISQEVVENMKRWKHSVSLQPSRLQPYGRLRRALRASLRSELVSIIRSMLMRMILAGCNG